MHPVRGLPYMTSAQKGVSKIPQICGQTLHKFTKLQKSKHFVDVPCGTPLLSFAHMSLYSEFVLWDCPSTCQTWWLALQLKCGTPSASWGPQIPTCSTFRCRCCKRGCYLQAEIENLTSEPFHLQQCVKLFLPVWIFTVIALMQEEQAATACQICHFRKYWLKFSQLGRNNFTLLCTVRVDSLPNRKVREIQHQPGTAGPGNMLGCCLISFHFLWGKLSTCTVHGNMVTYGLKWEQIELRCTPCHLHDIWYTVAQLSNWLLLLTRKMPPPPMRCGLPLSVAKVAPALVSSSSRPSVHSSRSEFQISTVSMVVSRCRVSPFIPPVGWFDQSGHFRHPFYIFESIKDNAVQR